MLPYYYVKAGHYMWWIILIIASTLSGSWALFIIGALILSALELA